MFQNHKFIHIETFLHQYLPSTVERLLDENMLHCDEDKESKKFSIEYFKEFTAGKMEFDAYRINPDFSHKNPLMILEESKKSITEFNYKKVISYNNIKVKDLITPRVVDVLIGGKGELIDKDDPNNTIQIDHALIFCRPYIHEGVNGALLLLDLEATRSGGFEKVQFPFATFFLSDTPKSLDIKGFAFEKSEIKETDYAQFPFFDPLFTYFFATIAILKMNSMVDIEHAKYTLGMMIEKQDELYRLIEENEGEGFSAFLEGLSQKLLTQLMNDPNIPNDRKNLIKEISENFEAFMDSISESDKNSAFENSKKFGDLQCGYLSEIMSCLKIPAYKERVESLHSTEMYERKLLTSKLFLQKWNNNSILNTILDNDNYFTYTDLFATIENFQRIENYDWLTIAKDLNVGFSDFGEGTILFSSNILQEMEYVESFTMLHSFIKPHKYQNIKGILFNIAFFKVIDFDEISNDNHDEIREMNTLYFFGIEKGEYKLWAVDHNLNTYSELKGSGVDSNLNDKISAQLCAIILYLNAVSFDQVEEYYCRGQADCINS
jgi:hypothetical protein